MIRHSVGSSPSSFGKPRHQATSAKATPSSNPFTSHFERMSQQKEGEAPSFAVGVSNVASVKAYNHDNEVLSALSNLSQKAFAHHGSVPVMTSAQFASPQGNHELETKPKSSVKALLHTPTMASISPKSPFVWENYLNNEFFGTFLLKYVIPNKVKNQVKLVLKLMANANSFNELRYNFESLGPDFILSLFAILDEYMMSCKKV